MTRLELVRRRGAHPHAHAVVGQDVEFVDVVVGLARPSPSARRTSCCRSCRRACTTGASPDPAPNVRPTRSASSRRRSSTTPGCTRACRLAGSTARMPWQCLEKSMTTATLQHCPARLVPAPRERTGAPNCAAGRHGGDDVVGVAGHDDADRHLPVVGRVGRVERAAGRVEPHLAPDGLPQAGLERAVHGGVGVKRRRRSRRRWMCGHGDPGGGAPALPPARRYQHTRGVRICEQ